jgi:hypothetical protein
MLLKCCVSVAIFHDNPSIQIAGLKRAATRALTLIPGWNSRRFVWHRNPFHYDILTPAQ